MRVFVALDIEPSIRDRIARFMDGVREFAPDARWGRPESLHITLKFIGEKPAEKIEEIKTALAAVKSATFSVTVKGHGFFPTPISPRVFWIGIDSGPELAVLADSVDAVTARLGIPLEEHRYSPHLTLARGGGRSGAPHRQPGDKPNHNFQRLQQKLAALPSPEFGTMTAHEFFLFESQLMRGGSRYTRIARFGLS